MKSLFIFCIGFIFLSTSAGLSQFIITSSVPADGAVGVPLSTTISFTFNAPLDTTMRYGELQYPISLLSPSLDSLMLVTVTYSPDLTTITFEITHTANTDFVWLIIGARNNAGQPLSQPYALNYTTSATLGNRSVSGTLTFEDGDPANAIVALADHALFTEEESTILVGAVVQNFSEIYTVNYVRDGVYWPVVMKDADGDGEYNPAGNDLLGFFDPNHDSKHNSIIVSGSDLGGIDMELKRLFAPVTASTYLVTAKLIANEYAPDQVLRGIGIHADPKGIDVGLDGTAPMWVYQFYSPSLEFPTVVIMSSFFTMADTTMEGFPSTGKTIPENFIDSDIAMAVADANGGHDFEAQHNIVRRTLYGGNMWSERFLQDSTKIIWVAEYEAIEPDSSSLIFRVFVDMISGQLITGAHKPKVSIPYAYSLSQNYPNPFNPTTVIRFSLPQRENIRLEVFDLLGKEAATLVNEPVGAGEHSVIFDARNFPAGVYFYQIQAGAFVKTKKLIVLR